MPRSLVMLSVLAVLVWSLVGCDKETDMQVYCAGGIRPPVKELADQFAADQGGLEIGLDYAGSGELLGRIRAMAVENRPDLYVAGDEYYGDLAAEQGLVDRVETLARFVPVVAVKADNQGIHSLADLAGAGVKVALGEPRATAIGKATDKLLSDRGQMAVRRQAVFTGKTVQELANQLLLGHVDAAIIWDATTRQGDYAGKFRIIEIPDAPAVRIVICRVKGTRHPELADAFIKAVTGEAAAAIFEKHGFTAKLKSDVVATSPDAAEGE